MGTLTKKIQRHDTLETMAPPMTGPRIGPSRVGIPMTAMTRFILSGPAVRAMIAWPTGMIMPPPKPWRTRNAMRAVADQARPQSTEPARNSTRDVM